MRRLVAAVFLTLTTLALAAGVAGAQDGGDGDSYLPNPTIDGVRASDYRVVVPGEDCKFDAGNSAVVGAITAPLGVIGSAAADLIPGIDGPSALCPGAVVKDGVGKATEGAWSIGVAVTSVLTDGLERLLTFDIANLLRPVVEDASGRVQTKIVDRFQLAYFALAFAGIVVGFTFLLGSFARGIAELGRVVLAIGIAGLILANVGGAFAAFSDFGREASSAALGIAGQPDAQHPLDPLRQALISGQWEGQQFGARLPAQCAEPARAALRDHKSVINAVDKAGCHDQAEHASHSSWWRLGAAIAYLVLVLVIGWQLIKMGVGLFLGQAALAVTFVFAPIACALAPFKWSRRIFGAWLGGVAALVIGMPFSALLLGVSTLLLGAILAAPWSMFWQLVVAAGVTCAVNKMAARWREGAERSAHHSAARVAVGGVAVGAGIGAGAVAAQGIVSSSHQRADLLAAKARTKATGVVVRAGGKTGETAQKAVAASPPAKGVQERREARHQVAQDEHRERVRVHMDTRRAKRGAPSPDPRPPRPSRHRENEPV